MYSVAVFSLVTLYFANLSLYKQMIVLINKNKLQKPNFAAFFFHNSRKFTHFTKWGYIIYVISQLLVWTLVAGCFDHWQLVFFLREQKGGFQTYNLHGMAFLDVLFFWLEVLVSQSYMHTSLYLGASWKILCSA